MQLANLLFSLGKYVLPLKYVSTTETKLLYSPCFPLKYFFCLIWYVIEDISNIGIFLPIFSHGCSSEVTAAHFRVLNSFVFCEYLKSFAFV